MVIKNWKDYMREKDKLAELSVQEHHQRSLNELFVERLDHVVDFVSHSMLLYVDKHYKY